MIVWEIAIYVSSGMNGCPHDFYRGERIKGSGERKFRRGLRGGTPVGSGGEAPVADD